MKKTFLCLTALVLICLTLAGCYTLGSYGVTKYADMVYTHPNMTAIRQALDAACKAARGEDFDAIIDSIWNYYDFYDDFYTNYSLADIKYCTDMTDIYWQQEYDYCAENSASVDAGLEELYCALAQSPCRAKLEGGDYFGAGYFDSYEQGSVWDETFLGLMEEENTLITRYYELSADGLAYDPGSAEYYDAVGQEMAQVLVDLIALRQETAAYLGYRSYVDFAYDYYYYRDYTPAQAEDFVDKIQRELTDLYREVALSDVWELTWESCSESDTLDYVAAAAKNMGGTVADAWQLLIEGGLYDISYSDNKYGASFEIYLTSYYEPFIFMNSTGTVYDQLTLAHEFGHFCNDYACYGSYAGIDVMEVMSQSMEYLSLCYGEDTQDLARVKLADSLCTYVEQAAYASFEQQMYALAGEELTVENLCRLYEQTILDFGLDCYDYDSREFVTITHYFTNPMYIISYVVSNDVALQIYQREYEEAGAGLSVYEACIYSEEAYFLAFLESMDLQSPFAEGRLRSVKEMFENTL